MLFSAYLLYSESLFVNDLPRGLDKLFFNQVAVCHLLALSQSNR